MNNDERTTSTESAVESNKCSENVCSPDRTTPENEHTFCTSSERSEKRIKRILNVLYGILAEDYYSDNDSENTPGHENSERSDSPVQIIRMAREINFIHEKVNAIISRLDSMDEEHNADISEIKSKGNKIFTVANNIISKLELLDDRDNVILSLVRDNANAHKNTTAILERLDSIDDKIRTILSLAQSNNLICYSLREHTKQAKDFLFDFTSAYPASILAEHKKSSHSERSEKLNKLFEMTPKQLPIWSLRNYKEVYEDSRLVHFWFYLKNYLYAPVQDILTDCAEYLFRWMHSEISGYCSEPTDDISEVQDITIYLDRMAAFYELVQAHKYDMSTDRYEAYMHIMSDIDILLSERSDNEVSELGGEKNGETP